jgi:uncharacterized membrane protein YcaP (DUF421 family)
MDAVLGMAVRATVTYAFLLILLRIAGKRTVSEGTPFDFVVALALGDFPDDIIWGEVPAAQGLLAMGTVMALHLCVALASSRSLRFDRLVSSGPTPILRGGRSLAAGLRSERMNEGDLDVQLRHHGHDERQDVQAASIEPTGEVAVLPARRAQPARRRDLRSVR